jgi:hypothetical protein
MNQGNADENTKTSEAQAEPPNSANGRLANNDTLAASVEGFM